MSISNDVSQAVRNVLIPEFRVTTGRVVPKTEDIVLRDGAIELEATYLYADLADSSGLAQKYAWWATAKVVRSYLNAAVRILTHYGGEIRSFDGDRVMAIFIGGSQATNAVRASLAINWAVTQVINPELKDAWTNFRWTMNHGVGVDKGTARLVRGGVRDNNDIVSIGEAPNIAAKLSERRGWSSLLISDAVFEAASDSVIRNKQGGTMWSNRGSIMVGGKAVRYHGSDWWWKPE